MSKNQVELQSFLKSHIHKKTNNNNVKHTHTRIRSDENGVYGGSYYINDDELDRFYSIYMDNVFKNGKKEYLTERQIDDKDVCGAILIDFDFRYNSNVTRRLHTKEHIESIICLYLEKLKENIFYFNVNQDIPVYVFEKPFINTVFNDDNTIVKDGIHIIIGIQCERRIQIELRKLVLEDISEYLSDLPYTNNIEDVIDYTITSGNTNWQLYGSRKPGNEAYNITGNYNCYLNDNNEIVMDLEENLVKYTKNVSEFKKLSAQYRGNIKLNLKPKMTKILDAHVKERSNNITRNSSSDKTTFIMTPFEKIYDWNCITSLDQLKKIHEKLMNVDLTVSKNQIFKETNDYLMLINDSKFYDPYPEWWEIGCALKNTDDRLFISWMVFSSKSKKFNINKIQEFRDIWDKMLEGEKCFTNRAIMRKAKTCYQDKSDNENEWLKLKNSSVDHFIETAILSKGKDTDMATILHCMYREEFMCAIDCKQSLWFQYIKNRWVKIQGQPIMSLLISKQLYDKLQNKMIDIINLLHNHPGGHESEDYKKKEATIGTLNQICGFCKDRSHKTSIIKEVSDLFYDANFLKNKDLNNDLLCFDNGVFDFTINKFRTGYHDDYITKSTNYEYIPMDIIKTQYQVEEQEIRTFFDQIYPIKEINDYIWNLLASLLIGGNMNQEFYMFIGNGSNGKSMVTKLLEDLMGDYHGILPSSCITGERVGAGKVSPEIIALKGTRVAIINEPKRNETLNDGIVKEMTGNTDKVQGRALYGDPDSFIPQFKPIVASNVTYTINDTTDGIWRRIKKINHISKFEDIPNLKNKNEFKKDKSLSKRFAKWAPVLMSLLIEITIKTRGVITTPQIIVDETLAYRNKQDLVSEFMNSRIQFKEGGKIQKTPLSQEFKLHLDRKVQKSELEELEEAMNKKFGEYDTKKRCWKNVIIVYEEDDDDDDN